MDTFFKGIPLTRSGRGEDVANLAVFLASEESNYVTGAEFVIDGGASIPHRLVIRLRSIIG